MPNTFSPRALVDVVGQRAKELRQEWSSDYDGSKTDIQEWHAMLDMMDGESTVQFLKHYSRVDDIPAVVGGVEEYRSPDEGNE